MLNSDNTRSTMSPTSSTSSTTSTAVAADETLSVATSSDGLGTPPLTVVGVVEHGNAWGRLLGFPTANLPLDDPTVDGIWAGIVRFEAQGRLHEYVAAISIGTRPTYYADGIRLLEAHLLDFSGSLYDIEITVELHELLRGQVRFDGSDALIAQLAIDVADTRTWAEARSQAA